MVQFFILPALNLVESLVDTFRDGVTPVSGSIVYCDLAFGYAEHSGIYLVNGRIAHLNGQDLIESVDQEEFLDGITGVSILVSSRDTNAVGNKFVADRARAMLGQRRSYNLILDNCHQFAAGCLTGDFNNANNFLWMLKHEASNKLRVNTWREWRQD
ncbi:MAG: lecithin retinol acyltransferase family protein [Paraglaciecola sp.]|nr:lecithin retinol acyltransferase family protein [Paraglaciecola sp.]